MVYFCSLIFVIEILKFGRLSCFDLFQVVQKLGSVATNAQDMFKRLSTCIKIVHMIDYIIWQDKPIQEAPKHFEHICVFPSICINLSGL